MKEAIAIVVDSVFLKAQSVQILFFYFDAFNTELNRKEVASFAVSLMFIFFLNKL
jgi:hypothetical protein